MKKTHKFLKAVLIIVLVLALVCLSVFFLAKKKIIFLNDWFVRESSGTIGVDISSYQADVDMRKLKEQQIAFVYIKASEGSTHQDNLFAVNWKNAQEAGLPAGAYHFFSYDSAGKTQAENFINTVGPDLNGRLIPVVDVEYYGDKEQNPPERENVIRELRAFLETTEKEYGVKPMIYTRPDIYQKYLKSHNSKINFFN